MKRVSLCCLLFLLVGLTPVLSFGQSSAYTSIVVFGDSLSDVGNDAVLSAGKYTAAGQVPGVASGYTNGRFTDGTDTTPAAKLYSGVWVEQLAAMLAAKPVVKNSLSGGADYAYGFATTNTGTTLFTYGPGNALNFSVNNMQQQVTDYLATNPTINNKVLFVVWGGANDLIAATTPADITNAAARDASVIQRLITAGATNFIVPNLPPLGLVPRFNGSPTTSVPATTAALGFNQALGAALAQLSMANAGKSLNIATLDTATLFNTVVATPANYGFTNVTASSQINPAVNPDTYLFWDDLHPTTVGHHLIAATAYRLLNTALVTNTTLSSSSSSANLGTNVTFTATVTNASGTGETPMGTVSIMDGSTVLSTSMLVGSGASATVTVSTSTLAAGTHPIQAIYLGNNGFGGSVSGITNQTVVPPTFAASLGATSTTIPRGAASGVGVTITPAGGYTGAFTVACGTLPAHFSCSVLTPSLTITGASGAVNTTVVIGTAATTSALRTDSRGGNGIMLSLLGVPLLGTLALFRRRLGNGALTGCVLVLSFAAFVGFSGCSGSDPYKNDSPTGTYTVPITVTPASGTAQTLSLSVVVQ